MKTSIDPNGKVASRRDHGEGKLSVVEYNVEEMPY